MHHCPECASRGLTLESASEGVRVYSCVACGHTVETTEVPSETLRQLVGRSLHLAKLQQEAKGLEKVVTYLP